MKDFNYRDIKNISLMTDDKFINFKDMSLSDFSYEVCPIYEYRLLDGRTINISSKTILSLKFECIDRNIEKLFFINNLTMKNKMIKDCSASELLFAARMKMKESLNEVDNNYKKK